MGLSLGLAWGLATGSLLLIKSDGKEEGLSVRLKVVGVSAGAFGASVCAFNVGGIAGGVEKKYPPLEPGKFAAIVGFFVPASSKGVKVGTSVSSGRSKLLPELDLLFLAVSSSQQKTVVSPSWPTQIKATSYQRPSYPVDPPH